MIVYENGFKDNLSFFSKSLLYKVQMVQLPVKVHLLQSLHQNVRLGTSHRNNTYMVAFIQSKDVIHVSREITKDVRIDLGKYRARKNFKVINTKEGKEVLLYFEEPYTIKISKNASSLMDWVVESENAQELLTIPIIKNIGLILPYKQIDEDNNTMTFEAYIVDPVWEPTIFRHGLNLDSI